MNQLWSMEEVQPCLIKVIVRVNVWLLTLIPSQRFCINVFCLSSLRTHFHKEKTNGIQDTIFTVLMSDSDFYDTIQVTSSKDIPTLHSGRRQLTRNLNKQANLLYNFTWTKGFKEVRLLSFTKQKMYPVSQRKAWLLSSRKNFTMRVVCSSKDESTP